MTEKQKKVEELLTFAKKGANDADLVLLDKINEVENKLDSSIKEIKENMPNLGKFLDSVRGAQGIQGVKGDKGETGERGPKGDFIVGQKGERGEIGPQGVQGKRGMDGLNGKDADEGGIVKKILKQIDMRPLWEELDEKLEEFNKKIKEIPGRPVTTIFGPGKTKIILKDLSTELNGSTKTFFIGTNYGIISVQSSSAPFGAFREVVDYNGVGQNIVFTSDVDAPSMLAAGQSLIVKYLR